MAKEKFEQKFDNLEDAGEAMRRKFGFEEEEIKKEEEKIIDKSEEKREELKPRSVGATAVKEEKKENREKGSKGKPYVYKEIDRLGENIGLAKKEIREAKTDEEKKSAEEKIRYFTTELEKAKEVRDRIKNKAEGKKEVKKEEIKAVEESQYTEYTEKDRGHLQRQLKLAEEEGDKKLEEHYQKALEQLGIQEKEEEFKENPTEIKKEGEIISPISVSRLSEEQIEEAKKIREDLAKTREKIIESEKVIELGDVWDVAEPTPEEKILEMPEAENLLKALDRQTEQIDKQIEKKSPWIREKIEKAAGWYKKQPLWKKVLFSVGCLGAASASAAVGGAVGAGIATAAFTGSISQRFLGGIATFVTVEGILKKAAEKGGRERTKWEARRHTTEAAVLGILVGSGKFAEAARNVAEVTGIRDIVSSAYAYHNWLPKKTEVPSGVKTGMPAEEAVPQPEVTPQPEIAPQPEAPVEKIIEYQGGKSIWQEAGKQWEARFKEFADLGGGDSKAAEALKTYNIDRIKDTVVDAIKSGDKDLMEKYGLAGVSDPDKLTVDQLKGIKWNSVFEDTLKEKGLIENLPSEQVENIIKNNAVLREFFKEYPNAPRTSGNYEDILRGEGNTGIVSEPQLQQQPLKIENMSEGEWPAGSKPEQPIQVQEVLDEDINKWVEKEFNVSPEKSNILNAEVLKSMHLRNIKVSDFIENKDKFFYGDGPMATRVEPEFGGPQWWELEDKKRLADKVEKILEKMSSEERLSAKKLTVPELILGEFIKK